MQSRRVQQGIALVAIAAILSLAIAAAFVTSVARTATGPRRAAVSDSALAIAREALIAHATSRPLDEIVGPGYLPCPDLNDDGWAESTCGSLTGETGQWQRLGRLPWKTLGLHDLRDAAGERLWYAVSSKHKGLLNCAASPACLDMGPEAALGTITVRDATGTVIHDGTSASPYDPGRGGAVAVIFAPGPPLARWAGHDVPRDPQVRTCEGGRCNAAGHCLTAPPTLTPKCDPKNYVDRSPGPAFSDEDNAVFIDRNDSPGRPANRDGFIRGPVMDHGGTIWVNDRLAVISYDDLMPRVMRRVAEEVAACLRDYALLSGNNGRLPWAAPACRVGDPNPTLRWSDSTGTLFGRVPDTPFLATNHDSDSTMSTRWVRGCRIADAAGTTAGSAGFTWWSAWKRHVFYSVASASRPSSAAPAECDAISCLFVSREAADIPPRGHRFAVLVAGHPLLFDSGRQSRDAAADPDVRNWLEGANADLRGLNANPAAPGCSRDPTYPDGAANSAFNRLATLTGRNLNDVVVAVP